MRLIHSTTGRVDANVVRQSTCFQMMTLCNMGTLPSPPQFQTRCVHVGVSLALSTPIWSTTDMLYLFSSNDGAL
jgi:hypothetical protein